MTEHSLETIARHLNGRLIGNGSLRIRGINSLDLVKEGELTFAEDARRLAQAMATPASAVIVPEDAGDLGGRAAIAVANPRLAFALVLDLFHPSVSEPTGVHPTAVIGAHAQIGRDVSIGAHAVIGEHVAIGDATVVSSGVHIGSESSIGSQCFIAPNVVVYRHTYIGSRVRIHGGTVIGGDGFGYVMHQGRYVKVPQVGNVIIEDDVEIGSNVCVDRATIGSTIIKQGTKIDNLVQIAHNDRIGRHVILCGQVGLSGSVTVGDYAVLAGQAGVVDHITIGDRAQVGAASPVTKSISAGEVVWGFPARPVKEVKEQLALLARLPNLVAQFKQLLARLAHLEEQSKADGKSALPKSRRPSS